MKLYKPEVEDLWFREELMGDPETMAYNRAWGGTIPFPKDRWQNWYDKWLTVHANQRYYRYLLHEETNGFVGEVAYHLDPAANIYIASIIIHAKHRGHGYGTEGLKLLCQAAKDNGLTALYDDIAADNPSVQLFLKNGFTVDHKTEEIVMVKKTLKETE